MEPQIEQIIEAIVPHTTPEHVRRHKLLLCTKLCLQHARVRYAACNALGQMSTDFAPTLQKKAHAKALPALLAAMCDVQCPRVAAHAGAAIVNFAEDCPKPILEQYLPSIMQTINGVLKQTYEQVRSSLSLSL